MQFKKAKREQDNKVLFEKLMAIQRIDPCRLEPMQYEFYREWYHTAILALLHIAPFKGNYKTLAGLLNPAITIKQAKESCELLTGLNLVDHHRRALEIDRYTRISGAEHQTCRRSV